MENETEMRRMRIGGLLLVLALQALPQTTTTVPAEFEVVSIKVSSAVGLPAGAFGGRRGSPGTNDPGQISLNAVTMQTLLVSAFGVQKYQIAGPSWLDSVRYDIVAKVPPGATADQVGKMYQTLLAQRFHLTIHHETKDLPVYEITIGKNGPKLKEATVSPRSAPQQNAAGEQRPSNQQPTRDAEGCLVYPDGRRISSTSGRSGIIKMCFAQTTLGTLATSLIGPAGRPVFDKTGLTGRYDLVLEFRPETGAPAASPGTVQSAATAAGSSSSASDQPALSIFAALQANGLRLEAVKAPIEMLVIDTLEKAPTEN